MISLVQLLYLFIFTNIKGYFFKFYHIDWGITTPFALFMILKNNTGF